MLFFVDELEWTRDGEAIVCAMRSRDPAAFVAPSPATGGVRIVARLDLRRMLEAFAEAGYVAVPEFRRVRGGMAEESVTLQVRAA